MVISKLLNDNVTTLGKVVVQKVVTLSDPVNLRVWLRPLVVTPARRFGNDSTLNNRSLVSAAALVGLRMPS